jgi:hypothetical protein
MTTMAIPIPDFSGLFLILEVLFVIFCATYIIWKKDRKSRYLTDYKTIVEEHDAAVRMAAWRLLIYLATLPVIVLLYIGAVSLVSVKPTWNFSLSLTIVAVNLIYMVWIVALPLWNLCVTTVHLWAAEINVYVRDTYPLEYYGPKPGNFKK